MLLHPFNPLFTNSNSLWLISESGEAIEIKASILFKFLITIRFFHMFFLFFLILELYSLIPALLHKFGSTAELRNIK